MSSCWLQVYLHCEHERCEAIVATDVEAGGRVGQQQLDHLHLFIRVVLRMARMFSMMMRMLLMTTVGAILNGDADGFGE